MSYDIGERLRVQDELRKNEQFICPANPNHILKSLDRQRCHVNTCGEIRNMGPETKIYFCQYYEGHMFMDKRQRDNHEYLCPWLKVPGNPPHDPTVNRFIVVKGNKPKSADASKKSSNNKGYQGGRQFMQPLVKTDFQFIREPNRINLELDQKFKQIVEGFNLPNILAFDNANVVTVSDARGELPDIVDAEFQVSNQQMKLLTLTDWMATCIQHGIPYCEEFKINHTISLDLRNKLQARLRAYTLPDNFKMEEFLPCEVLEEFLMMFPVKSYDQYLNYMRQEYKVKVPMDKFEREFIECIKKTTDNHGFYKMKTVICDFSEDGLLSVLVPKQFMQLTQHYATSQSDLIQLVYKLKDSDIQFLQPHVKSRTLFPWTGIKQETFTTDTSKMEIEDNKQTEKIEYEKVLDSIEKYKQIMRAKEVQIQHKMETILKLSTQEQEFKQSFETLRILGDRDLFRLKETEAKPKQKFKEVHQQIKQTQDDIYRQNQKLFEQFKTEALSQASELLNQAEGCMIEVQTLTSRIERANDKHKKLWDRIKKSETEQLQIKNRTIEETHQNVWHVGDNIICQVCGKYRTNIMYLPCYHAPICQVCYTVLKKQDISHCIFCNEPCKKILHLNWENGFMLAEQDVRVFNQEQEEQMIIEQ